MEIKTIGIDLAKNVLPEFIQRFGTEEQCAAALETARWPDGFHCPSATVPSILF